MMITYGFHLLQLRLSPGDQHLGSYKTKFIVLNAHALQKYCDTHTPRIINFELNDQLGVS